jgi:hypothetical protein
MYESTMPVDLHAEFPRRTKVSTASLDLHRLTNMRRRKNISVRIPYQKDRAAIIAGRVRKFYPQ